MKSNLPQRKNIRLKYYDYSTEGYYFITICTRNRLELLGKIDVGVALQGDPKKTKNIILSRKGKIVKKHIENCNKKIKNITIDEYVIMPNHIHLIIAIKRVAEDSDPYSPKYN